MRPAHSAIAQAVSALDNPTPRPERARPVALLVARYPDPQPSAALHEGNELERLGQPVVVLPLRREERGVRAGWRSGARSLRRYHRALAALLGDEIRESWSRPARLLALRHLPRALELAEQAERLGVAHLHAGAGDAAAVTAFAVHRLTGVPFSVTLGADDVGGLEALPPGVLAAASFVRCRWEADRGALLARGLGERVRLIRAAVGVRERGAAAAAGEPHIVCAGPIDERGGHLTLVAACLRLRRRRLGFTCDILGDGPLRTRVEAAIDAVGLEGVVRVLSARAEMDERVEQAAVVVHAGLHPRESRDAVWLPLLRAMAARRAIVLADGPAAREMVEDGVSGVLVPAGDPDALADALERLLRQPEVARWLGEQARRKAGREFDLAQWGRQLVEALRA